MADNTLQDIKERLDVVEVIGSYIPVKKSGTNFKANCPFHNEKSASLMISPQKQIWHCFGCGEGGDVFGFVMRYENLEFREALQILAQRAGVQLPERSVSSSQAKQVTEELIRINNFTARFYHKLLKSDIGVAAKEYIKSRGLTEGTVDQWLIGYAPDSFDSLLNALRAKQVEPNQALQAGVLAKSEKGKLFDRFRNRITFAIHNYYGDVVGFSARTMETGDVAKYINSPETPVYNKSKILFGLHFAREAIRKADEVVIVEGQMDCISAHQAGFANTVATSGTAMTEDHLRLLGRLTKNLKFCFDADTAGLAALRKAGEMALPNGFRIKAIILQEAKDPDELIRQSPGLWKRAVADGLWFIDYYLKVGAGKFPYGTYEQKIYIKDEIIPMLLFNDDPLEIGHYTRYISENFAISENEVRDALKKARYVKEGRPMENMPRNYPIAQPAPVAANEDTIQEKEILGGLLVYPEFKAFVQEEGLPSEYISEEMRSRINTALVDGGASVVQADPLANEAIFMIESTLENLANNELALMRELKKSFYQFKKAGINKQLQDTTIALKKAESLHDTAEIENLNKLFVQLSGERNTLEKKLEG